MQSYAVVGLQAQCGSAATHSMSENRLIKCVRHDRFMINGPYNGRLFRSGSGSNRDSEPILIDLSSDTAGFGFDVRHPHGNFFSMSKTRAKCQQYKCLPCGSSLLVLRLLASPIHLNET